MALNQVNVEVIRNLFENTVHIDYNDQYHIEISIVDAQQSKQFVNLCNISNDLQFEEVCGFPKSEIMLYGDTTLDGNRYDKDEEYRKDIDFYLNLVLPSVKEGNKIKYACYSVVRQGKPILFKEPTLCSSFKCLLSHLNNPEYIVARRVKNN